MLRKDVVDAVVQKKFHITAIDEVDEALELLTGLPAGELDKKDNYAQGSINALVVERLDELHKLHKQSSDDEHDE